MDFSFQVEWRYIHYLQGRGGGLIFQNFLHIIYIVHWYVLEYEVDEVVVW